jgi:hypothetical protein
MDIAYCVRDTYAPARFGELPLLSVPYKTDYLTRSACFPQDMKRWFGKLDIYIDFGLSLANSTKKPLNQRSNSASPGIDHGDNSCSNSPGLCPWHAGNTRSTSPGRYHGGNLGRTLSADAYATQVTPAHPRPADAWVGSISSTSPGPATVLT